ncbi:potassium channel family protein [Agromyces archimandritae]|uniref:Potassium channel domain-containing protein n=1 Tax=Agromyces archimandritae TaxID=2781962 RepID=A0A975IPE6_9MICO|nr:potassium channel family protein [Agromyces archimandritae]QTX05194.1 hypothetical protein G127AT_02895 [Agromyces archimandritae]
MSGGTNGGTAATERVAAVRRERWERAVSGWLVAAGLVFIVAYSVWVLAPALPDPLRRLLLALIAITWAAFAVDVVVRIVLTPAGGRWRFAFTHPVDVLSVVFPVFRAFRVIALIDRVAFFRQRDGAAVRSRIVALAGCYALVFVYFISLTTLEAEREVPGATITTFGDAVWWAFVTIATVGYGDTYPVTPLGRVAGVALMMGGVAIVGTASATILSFIDERIGRRRPRPPSVE